VSVTSGVRSTVFAAAIAALAARAAAQGADSAHTLPADVAGEAAYRYNLPAALRAQGATTIEAGRTVAGNVAVRDGALTIAGTVRGSVIVINGSARLLAGARVDSDLVVVGGAVQRDSGAAVGGQLRAYGASLPYRMQGDAMVATPDTASGEWGWFKRWQTRYDSAQTKFALKAGTYDRVEGLPVMAGISLRRNWDIGQLSLVALGIYRSVNGFDWTPNNLGYDVTAELRRGKEKAVTFGVRFVDVVAPVEDWQLSNSEISLFSFVVRQDERDYYNAQGGSAWATVRRGATSATLRYSQSTWEVRTAEDPISLFHTSNPWRANPVLDAGLVRRVDGGLTYDTRNDAADPWTGWLVSVDVEGGWASSLVLGPTSEIARPAAPAPASVTYGRGWLDLRRYDRISPEGHLNARVVYGTQLGGGEMPLERRFSMGGPGSLPGYEFRQLLTPDVFTCSDATVPSGQPAQCTRMLLAQVEYRADFTLRMFARDGKDGEAGGYRIIKTLSWVLFTDAGRGWVTGPTADGVSYGSWTLPPLYTFRADAGAGFDLGWLGVYAAKSLSDWKAIPLQFVVRLQHRF
jgi:hypothetical protein